MINRTWDDRENARAASEELYGHVSTQMQWLGLDAGILEWMANNAKGRDAFRKGLIGIAKKYHAAKTLSYVPARPRRVTVNTGRKPLIPLPETSVSRHISHGIALLELRDDDNLYLAGRRILFEKVALPRRVCQLTADHLHSQMNSVVLNANIGFALEFLPEMIPAMLKQATDDGKPPLVLLLGTSYQCEGGEIVPTMSWNGTGMHNSTLLSRLQLWYCPKQPGASARGLGRQSIFVARYA